MNINTFCLQYGLNATRHSLQRFLNTSGLTLDHASDRIFSRDVKVEGGHQLFRKFMVFNEQELLRNFQRRQLWNNGPSGGSSTKIFGQIPVESVFTTYMTLCRKSTGQFPCSLSFLAIDFAISILSASLAYPTSVYPSGILHASLLHQRFTVLVVTLNLNATSLWPSVVQSPCLFTFKANFPPIPSVFYRLNVLLKLLCTVFYDSAQQEQLHCIRNSNLIDENFDLKSYQGGQRHIQGTGLFIIPIYTDIYYYGTGFPIKDAKLLKYEKLIFPIILPSFSSLSK